MEVTQNVDAEYGYHEDFEIVITGFHSNHTVCLNWSSVTSFGSKKYRTPAGAERNRHPKFYGSPRGRNTIETVVTCHCSKEDGEAMAVSDVDIIRTKLTITSTPSKARIFFSPIGQEPVDTYLLTTETLELGAVGYSNGYVKVRKTGYNEATKHTRIVKGGKSEIHLKLTKA